MGKAEKQAEAERKADDLFLKLLRRHTDEGRNITDKKGTSYAPAIFADEPETRKAKVSKKALAAAMSRLFEAKRIRMITEGPPSRARSRIVEVAEAAPTTEATKPAEPASVPSSSINAFQQPSTPLPPASTSVCTLSPPYPLSEVEGGRALVEDAPTFHLRTPEESCDGKESGGAGKGDVGVAPLARVLAAWIAAIGVAQTRSVDQVIEIAADNPELKAALLAVAPMDDGQTLSNVHLTRWLRDFNGVVVDHLMLQGGGGDENGSPQWTLTLLVEPDRGPLSL